jgi:hypothetical protein
MRSSNTRRSGGWFVSVLLLFVVASVADAQTTRVSDKRAVAQELLTTIGATQTAKAIFQSLISQYSTALAKDSVESFEKKNWPPQSRERAKALAQEFYKNLSDRLRDEVPRRIRYDEIVTNIYLDSYESYFSESEMRELISFYKSPVGQKFLAFGPAMAGAIQQRSTRELESLTLSVTREIVEDELNSLNKRAMELERSRAKP